MMEKRIRWLGCVMLLSGAAVASAQASAQAAGQERVVAPIPSLAPLVERVAPAVVNITVTETVDTSRASFGRPQLDELFGGQNPFEDAPPELQGAGSGVIVDAAAGYVLTNHHVIADATDIQVVLADHRSFDATVIGSDPESDVAVIQIDAQNLTAVPLASGDELKVGDYVVAIGNPFGLGQTVTSGIVSALGRTRGIYGEDGYEDFIQTDASINVGNSGGALINLKGELVGINSAILSRTGDSVGIGFAIPSQMVISVMDRLLEFGEVPRGLLGVRMESVDPTLASEYGLSVGAGALVVQVIPDSAAERAGIRINDVIVGVNGMRILDGNALRNLIAMQLPNQSVSLQLIRDGRQRSIDAVLAAKASPEGTRRPIQLSDNPRPSVFSGIDLMAESGRNPGLRVIDIDNRASAQARRSLAPGDLITAINQHEVDSVAEAMALTEDVHNVLVRIERDSQPQLIRLR
jgi:serine protease Do/serine protease DegQ